MPVQTSSGADYRVRLNGIENAQVDDWVMQSADVEPLLTLPARIGLATLGQDDVWSDVAADAGFAAWRQTISTYAASDVVPINPLVVELMQSPGKGSHTIRAIRRAAARQHLDAVVVLRHQSSMKRENTAMAFVDLTIIGGLFLPTRQHSAKFVADAMLIDVRNGYVYATATASKQVNGVSGSWGAARYTRQLKKQAKEEAIVDLRLKIAEMFDRLERELHRKSEQQ